VHKLSVNALVAHTYSVSKFYVTKSLGHLYRDRAHQSSKSLNKVGLWPVSVPGNSYSMHYINLQTNMYLMYNRKLQCCLWQKCVQNAEKTLANIILWSTVLSTTILSYMTLFKRKIL